jgi:hypothetical protein
MVPMAAERRLVLCDAHISPRTMNFLADIGIPDDHIVIEHNAFQPNQRAAYEVEYNPRSSKLPKILQLLQTKLDEGKNIVFATTSKKFLLKIQALAAEILKPDEFVCYCADSQDKDALVDVEAAWRDKRLVAYNTTISVGIDFNIDHFDLLFVHAINYGCGPVRDIFQSMHRVRKLKENTMFYSLSSTSERNNPPVTRDMAVAYLTICAELASKHMPSTAGEMPHWLYNLNIHNILEVGKSKADYERVFNQYLEMCGNEKKQHL